MNRTIQRRERARCLRMYACHSRDGRRSGCRSWLIGPRRTTGLYLYLEDNTYYSDLGAFATYWQYRSVSRI